MIRRPARLRTRITVSFVLLLALWGTLLAVVIGYVLAESARRFHRQQGAQLARALAIEAAPLFYYEDLAGIAALLDQKTESNPDIRYAAVLDSSGRAIWSTFPGDLPKDLLGVQHSYVQEENVSVRLIRSNGEKINDYEAMKNGLRIRLGLSLAPVEALVRRITLYSIVIGLAGLIAVLLTALVVSRPLETLSRAIERAVALDRTTGGPGAFDGTLETSVIGNRFQALLDRLEERTRQLDAAKKLAYLGEISATIAHEVNNPLGVLALNSDFLSARVKAGEINSGAGLEIQRLQAASKRATLAVQKLLQFARYTTRPDTVSQRPAHVSNLIQECVDLLSDRCGLAECSIHVDVQPGLDRMTCDEQGVQQILFNLLTNSIDASTKGSVVDVRAHLGEGRLTFQVMDRGKGMNPDELRRAMEPFFSTKEMGVGLGLAVSKSIAAAHGGELTLESREGEGTTATLTLPEGGTA